MCCVCVHINKHQGNMLASACFRVGEGKTSVPELNVMETHDTTEFKLRDSRSAQVIIR